jgi:hypothetical protein
LLSFELSDPPPTPSKVDVFYVDDKAGEIVYLRSANLTLDELLDGRAAAQADQGLAAAQAEERRQRRLANSPRRAVTLGDVLGRDDLPTLRQAASTIVEQYCGRISERDGRLRVEVPEMLEPGPGEHEARARVAAATIVLLHAEPLVLAELGRRGRLDVERLPDRPLAAGGTVA